jgi:predicted phosphodiesterase
MRIAVIADIHGNLPALEAALADIRARGITRLLNLGDCASGMMWPRETTALLMRAEVPTLRGNHDRWLAEQDPAAMGRQDAFAHGETDAEQRAWLGGLPDRLHPAPGVLACHGTPSSDTTNLLEEPAHGHLGPAPPGLVRERLGAEGNAVTVVLCGHSHLPSIVRLPGGDGPLVVNPGSLGCPAFRGRAGRTRTVRNRARRKPGTRSCTCRPRGRRQPSWSRSPMTGRPRRGAPNRWAARPGPMRCARATFPTRTDAR